jgi:hypothetical protein
MNKVRAVCIWSGFRQVGEKRTPKISLRFKLLEGVREIGAEEVYGDLWLSDKAADKTIKTLGGVFGYFGIIQEFCHRNDLLNGIEVVLVGEYKSYNGKEEWKVEFINAVGDEGWGPSSEDDLAAARAFDDKYRGKALAFQQQIQQQQAAKAAATGTPAKPSATPVNRATPRPPAESTSGTINWADVKPKPKPAPPPEAPPVEAYGEGPAGPEEEGDGLPF